MLITYSLEIKCSLHHVSFSFRVLKIIRKTENYEEIPIHFSRRWPSCIRWTVLLYRCILLSDSCHPQSPLFPNISNGGCYSLKLDLPNCRKTYSTSIQTVFFTPSGISIVQIFDAVISDIVTGTLDGFDCIDRICPKWKIYSDMQAVLGGFPALLEILDVISTGPAQPVLNAHLDTGFWGEGPEYAYSTYENTLTSHFKSMV